MPEPSCFCRPVPATDAATTATAAKPPLLRPLTRRLSLPLATGTAHGLAWRAGPADLDDLDNNMCMCMNMHCTLQFTL